MENQLSPPRVPSLLHLTHVTAPLQNSLVLAMWLLPSLGPSADSVLQQSVSGALRLSGLSNPDMSANNPQITLVNEFMEIVQLFSSSESSSPSLFTRLIF